MLFAGIASLLLCWLVYWVCRVISAVTMGGVPNCPRCGLMNTSQSSPKLGWDWVFGLFGCTPYKCAVCRIRYHRPHTLSRANRRGR